MNTNTIVRLVTIALAAAVALPAMVAAQPRKEPEPRLELVISAAAVADAAAAAAPDSKLWAGAKPQTVSLQPQQFVEPFQEKAAVASVQVRALRDEQRLALLLEWADQSENSTIGPAQFSDGCGVMFAPSGTPPSVMMGATGRPVRLFNWKAAWATPSQLAPLAWVDVVPLSGGSGGPIRPDTAIYATAAKATTGGWAVDNPVSGPSYPSLVEELVAEGPGTITHKGFAPGGGGSWKGGRWRVVLVLPGELAATSPVAFAVWDGGQRDAGSRKSISPWVTLDVKR
ncbi:MAG: hypothetical protein HY699_24985 [Deltaproteobacteria bacterium]|nr:hypothetical protein [Deltaproteobacteria bacterium]